MITMKTFITALFLLQTIDVTCLNITRMIIEYEAACGDMSCDKMEQGSKSNNSNSRLYKRQFCPECSCPENCLKTRNCCLDKFLQWNFTCVDTNIINRGIKEDQPHAAMIDTCFADMADIPSNCNRTYSDIIMAMQNVPVTSNDTGITYKNMDCLQCNEGLVKNVHLWKTEIKCEKFADFNFLSSSGEIVDQVERSKCRISYISPPNLLSWENMCSGTSQFEDNNVIINKCNVTGTWLNFDSDVDQLCRMYDNKFKVFKNIFCYLCNPPPLTGSIIDKCNVSGNWEIYDIETESKCESGITSKLTFPFKNFYCYMCNTGLNEQREDFFFKEFDTSEFLETNNVGNKTKFDITFTDFRLHLDEILEGGIQIHNKMQNKGDPSTEMAYNISNINMTSLMIKYFAYTGKTNFREQYSFVNSTNNCDQSDACYFDSSCCIEKYFDGNTECTNPSLSTDGRGHLVINSCPESRSTFIEFLCSSNIENYFLTTQPVYIENGTKTYMYKNIFCASCHWDLRRHENLDLLKLLKLRVSCLVFLPTFYFHTIDRYLDFLAQNDCIVRFVPILFSVTCAMEGSLCNSTGNMVTYDKDIEYSCMNIPNTYETSAFCDLCNPVEPAIDFITECNQTGNWGAYDLEIHEYCQNLPLIESSTPYKNYFCGICNPGSGYSGSSSSVDFGRGGIYINDLSYRSIFALSNYNQKRIRNTNKDCNESQTFILGKCRELVCYPGRVLGDTGCIPLLEITSNLGYIISRNIKITFLDMVDNITEFHNRVDQVFEGAIVSTLNISSLHFYFESSILEFHELCPHNQGNRTSANDLYVQFKFFIKDEVNRTSIENALLEFKFDKFNMTLHNFTGDIFDHFYYNPVHVTSFVQQVGFTDKCRYKHIHQVKYLPDDMDRYFHSYVNDLLSCEQVELTEDEFSYDEKEMAIRVNYFDSDVPSNNFLLLKQSKVRLCVDYINSAFRTSGPLKRTDLGIWDIVTFVCFVVSLVCLFVTFVTYCLFKTLRTVPGRNNMCLVFAMFNSNVSLLFMAVGASSHVGCLIIGIFVHFFWLATFACLNVCAFHMFRVFTLDINSHVHETKTTVLYVLYSFGVPALVVVVNILITFLLTGDTVGYGKDMCFLDSKLAFIITFIVPISTVCLVNIIFFVMVFKAIVQRPKLKNDSGMIANRIQSIVYMKLFAITGITWVFQIIDSFIPESTFSTIVAILNALQGVFIFLSYICNKRVLDLYRLKLKLKTNIPSSKNSSGRTVTKISNIESSRV